MARIASVLVCNVCVPLDRIISFATRSVKVRHYCLVKVRSSDGAEGLGYCYAGNSAGNIVRSAVQDLLAPLLIREDSTRVFCGSHVEPEPVHPRGSVRRASHFGPGRQTGNYPETGSGKSALHFKPNSFKLCSWGHGPIGSKRVALLTSRRSHGLPTRASSAKFQRAFASSSPHTQAFTRSRCRVSSRSAAMPATNTNKNGVAMS